MVMNGEWVIADVFGGSKRGANCEFIAHSRADIPYLLARVETLKAACKVVIDDWEYVTTEGAACEGCPDPHYVKACRAALEGEDNG